MPKCNALITGNYRSGTEYLSNLLNAHKNVTSEMYATNFLRYYYKALTVEDFKTSIATHLIERKIRRSLANCSIKCAALTIYQNLYINCMIF